MWLWKKKKSLLPLSLLCLGWVTLFKGVLGVSGLLRVAPIWNNGLSHLLWGWSRPSASHLNCSWGILLFCLLYPQGTIYTNKTEQEKNLRGKPLMLCTENPCTICYVNRGISHYKEREKNHFYYNEHLVSRKWLHNPGSFPGSLGPTSATLR